MYEPQFLLSKTLWLIISVDDESHQFGIPVNFPLSEICSVSDVQYHALCFLAVFFYLLNEACFPLVHIRTCIFTMAPWVMYILLSTEQWSFTTYVITNCFRDNVVRTHNSYKSLATAHSLLHSLTCSGLLLMGCEADTVAWAYICIYMDNTRDQGWHTVWRQPCMAEVYLMNAS